MASGEQPSNQSDDVVYLREQLKIAQERLASYQKFDLDLAEHVRRSSELMLEAMRVRDRMDLEAAEQAAARQERLAGKLQDLRADAEGIQASVGALLERVIAMQEEIGTSAPSVPPAPTAPLSVPLPDDLAASPEPEPGAAIQPAPEELPAEPAPPTRQSVDLIVHGMSRAASALALQSHLRALSQVEAVDAREFSSGVLRLHLDLSGDLPDADLLGWEGDDEVTIIRHQPDAIELRIGE